MYSLISLRLFPVNALGHAAPNGIPRGADPVAAFKKNKINVDFERAPDSAMTDDEFMRGFDGMKTLGRRHWIEDIINGKFKMVKQVPSAIPVTSNTTGNSGGGASSSGGGASSSGGGASGLGGGASNSGGGAGNSGGGDSNSGDGVDNSTNPSNASL